MDEKLKNYINTQRAKGTDDEVIRRNLAKAGWNSDKIEQAMVEHVSEIPAAPPPASPEPALEHKRMTVIQPSTDFLNEQATQQTKAEPSSPSLEETAQTDNVTAANPPAQPSPVMGSLGVLSPADTNDIYPEPGKKPVVTWPQAAVPNTSPTDVSAATQPLSDAEAEAVIERIMPDHTTYISNPFSAASLAWKYAKQHLLALFGISTLVSLVIGVAGYYAANLLVVFMLSAAFGVPSGEAASWLSFIILILVTVYSVGTMLSSRLHYRTMASQHPANMVVNIGKFITVNIAAIAIYLLLIYLYVQIAKSLPYDPSGGTGATDFLAFLFMAVMAGLYYIYVTRVSLLPFAFIEKNLSIVASWKYVQKISRKRRREVLGLFGISLIIQCLLSIAATLIVNNINFSGGTYATEGSLAAAVMLTSSLVILPFMIITYIFTAGFGYRYLAYRQVEDGEVEAPHVDIMNVVVTGVAVLVLLGTYYFNNNYTDPSSVRTDSLYQDSFDSGSFDYSYEPQNVDTSSEEYARDIERKSDINTIHRYLELYYTDNSSYPASLDDLTLLNQDAKQPPAANEQYFFEPTNDNGDSCSTESSDCTRYRLYTQLETDANGDGQVGATDIFERNSLNF